jgi:hypothetical protein
MTQATGPTPPAPPPPPGGDDPTLETELHVPTAETEAPSGPDGPTTEAPPAAPREGGRRGHRALSIACLVLAAVLLLVSATTTWVRSQVLDTDNWVSTSSELLEEPEVVDALARYAVDQLYDQVDIAGELEEVLPEALQPLAGAAAAAVRQPATDGVAALLGTDRVQRIWAEVNRRAHTILVGVLEDDLEVVSTTDGTVTLNLGDVIRELGASLGLPADVLDRIPDDAGQIVLVSSDQLAAAQRAVEVTQVVSTWAFIVVLALYVLAVFLAPDRRKALRNAGWTIVGVGILLLLVHRLALAYLVSMVEVPTNEPPVRAAYRIASVMLVQLAWAGILIGLVVVLGALYAGPSRAATALRRAFAPAWNIEPWGVWAAATVVFALILLWSPTPAFEEWWSALVIAVLYAAGIEVLRRRSRVEFPDARLGGWDAVQTWASDLWGRVGGSGRTDDHRPAPPSDRAPLLGAGTGAQGAATGAPSGDAASSTVERLERLAELHRSGAITDAEYTAAKAGVLSASST